MTSKQVSILDQGYWESAKSNSRSSKLSRVTKWLSEFIKPSFLAKKPSPRNQLRRTAYLDGLRGFAAFMVYWGHHQTWSRDAVYVDKILENGFGYDGNYYFACLPGVRIFFSGGHYAVTIFFVISGYVLSTKPLSLIQAGEHSKLADNLASALFRRWLRLHIPVICTTWLFMTSWHAFGIWTDSSPRRSNYRDELFWWYAEFKNFSFVFRTGGEPIFSYDYHVWSIPVEFRGSIVIYTALLAFSKFSRNARLGCEIALMYYFMYIVDGWFCALFMSGMFLCDLDLLAAAGNLPKIFSRLEPYKTIIYYNLFAISILLGGVPSHKDDKQVLRASPGWYYLSFLQPQAVYDYKWFFLFWAATFMVAAIPRIPWLKRFFEMRFNQYLGRISFAFYLVHGPVLWILADRLYSAVGWTRETHAEGIPEWMNLMPLPKGGPLGLDLAFLLPHLIILPVTLWLSEVATKLFDEPSVRFSQWLYKIMQEPSEKVQM